MVRSLVAVDTTYYGDTVIDVCVYLTGIFFICGKKTYLGTH